MTPKQFKRRRIAMGFLTQKSCAEAMGITQACVAQWESGKNSIPRWAILMLDLIERVEVLTRPDDLVKSSRRCFACDGKGFKAGIMPDGREVQVLCRNCYGTGKVTEVKEQVIEPQDIRYLR